MSTGTASVSAPDESLQCGAQLLEGYQRYWYQIRSKCIITAAQAKKAERGFCKFIDYWYKLHSECVYVNKELSMLPQMRQEVEEIRQNISQLCKKVDRVELVLDRILEIRNQQARGSLDSEHMLEIEKLKASQEKEIHEVEQQILSSLHKKNSMLVKREEPIQKILEKDMKEYKRTKEHASELVSSDNTTFQGFTIKALESAIKALKDIAKQEEEEEEEEGADENETENEFMAEEDDTDETDGEMQGDEDEDFVEEGEKL